ncbi:LytTR family DNA-binding domain-containing protein [Tahibacter sp.]|uniref:LytTR family DNA-binding domain-containing protein n=1 Tax=Tahibacter sp. TaxID=2056211 RepID=UPI0028C4C087|nr:LytTR family DNA-binding domain-containing protein [Tahibacter sp.]
MRKTPIALQAELVPQRFARIHRSLLVRVGGVVEIEPLDSARYRLRRGSGRMLVSRRSYRAQVRECFGMRGF